LLHNTVVTASDSMLGSPDLSEVQSG
jgi:hypothetical protein